MMKNTLIFLLCSNIALAQKDSSSKVHIGFVYPLSTNGQYAKQYSNDASFHVLAGVSANENAFCFSGISTVVRNNANGFIFSGISNYIGGCARGLQFAGASNYIGGKAEGLQFAGLSNISQSTVKGIQFAGFSNVAKDTVDGIQIAGFSNVAKASGTQIAGFSNASKMTRGIQLCGFSNVTKSLNGAQISGFSNVAKNVKGIQISGFVNVAKKVKGAQIAGFVNIAEECDYPIALVNIIKKGEQYLGANIDETGTSLISLRSGSKKMYGILGVGANFTGNEIRYAMEGGLGLHIPLNLMFRIKAEMSILSLSDFGDGVYMKSTLRLLPSMKIGRCFELFAGPALSFSNYPLSFGEDYSSQNLWSRKSNGTFYGINIGGVAGFQVRL